MNRRKTIRKAAGGVCALCAAVMTAVCCYAARLPDSYSAAPGDAISLNTMIPVSERPSRGTALEVSAGGEGSSTQVTLGLFGRVPVKEVTKNTAERPVLIAGGQAVGIKLVTDGVMIIDMKKLSGVCPAEDAGLMVGDVIETVNGESVRSNARISELIRASGGTECVIGYRRAGESRECSLTPVFSGGSYRAGMWVRDSSAGIGTLTFIDPETGAFAGLGHSICDPDTREPLPLSEGTAAEVSIVSVSKSTGGEPGQLLGDFTGADLGRLTLNCASGVYGVMDSLPEEDTDSAAMTVYPLSFAREVHPGSAYMIAQAGSGSPERFRITIESVSVPGSDIGNGHDLVIRVCDSRLTELAGGIVQGMSGSPIIQDGRLAGAVTHVFVDDPGGGYGIFAERMYECMKAAE